LLRSKIRQVLKSIAVHKYALISLMPKFRNILPNFSQYYEKEIIEKAA